MNAFALRAQLDAIRAEIGDDPPPPKIELSDFDDMCRIAGHYKHRADHLALKYIELQERLDAIAKEVGPEPKYISVVVDSGMGCTETYIPMHALDHYKHRADHIALKYIELREAAEAMTNQIEINDFEDGNGHEAKMLKAYHDMTGLLARGK